MVIQMASYPKEKATNTMPISGVGYYIDENNPDVARALQGSLNGFYVQEAGITTALTSLAEIAVAERTPLIELNSSYGLTELRDDWQEIDGATVTSSATAEYELITNTTGTARAVLDSIKTGRYVPGYPAEIGIGLRIAPNQVFEAGHVLNWGGLDYTGENGLLFGYDDTGYYVNRRNLNVDNIVYQANWNIDPLDGTGPSGFNLDRETGAIYRIEYTWYGYGEIRFGVIAHDAAGNQTFIPCHAFTNFTETSIARPNLKIHVSAENGGATSSIKAFVAGRQYSVVGKYVAKYRHVDEFVEKTISDVPTPLISFTRKADFQDRSILLDGFEISTTSAPILVEFFIKTTLTGFNFVNPDSYTANEVSVLADTSSTSKTGGILIYRKLITGTTGGKEIAVSGGEIDYDLQNNVNITMTARVVSGTATPDVTAQFKLKEEW